MIRWIKEKNKIHEDAFELGKEKGKKASNHKWKIKFTKYKRGIEKLLAEKEKKIESLNKKVIEIEKTMEKLASTLSRARYAAMQIEEENEINLKRVIYEDRDIKTFSQEMQTINRHFEKQMPQVEKKINEFKKEALQ